MFEKHFYHVSEKGELCQVSALADARNGKLLKLHMFEVPELEHALCEAGFEDFEPLVYGGVIILRARKGR